MDYEIANPIRVVFGGLVKGVVFSQELHQALLITCPPIQFTEPHQQPSDSKLHSKLINQDADGVVDDGVGVGVGGDGSCPQPAHPTVPHQLCHPIVILTSTQHTSHYLANLLHKMRILLLLAVMALVLTVVGLAGPVPMPYYRSKRFFSSRRRRPSTRSRTPCTNTGLFDSC
ncbi:hypothetical protein Pcinc_023159 [Petrolisthes cinctipes]|uniref:Uncharacterized protein n=1 Tax=Petrolisthes cinctipes TaxID=88211 RepID=A0AAE1FG62_PETCI|nr:hypothetical protein Pcinc_023159 [Petrolisthes cinctipes]